jgi:signal transduction histidine kinase
MENPFNLYRRKVNEGQELGGLAMGLALSKMIAVLHGGKIEVENQEGGGSTISFVIQLYQKKDLVNKFSRN